MSYYEPGDEKVKKEKWASPRREETFPRGLTFMREHSFNDCSFEGS